MSLLNSCFWFFGGIHPRFKLLDHMINWNFFKLMYLTFWGTAKLFPTETTSFTFPTTINRGSSFSMCVCSVMSDSMDCSLPGSSVHVIFQAEILDWVAISYSNFYSSFSTSSPNVLSCFFGNSYPNECDVVSLWSSFFNALRHYVSFSYQVQGKDVCSYHSYSLLC